MFRIDNTTAVPAFPVVPPLGVPGYFTNGNPGTGLAPTVVDDWWMNTVQEEILTVVVNAGLTPDKANHTQLWQALEARYEKISAVGGPYLPLTGGTLSGPLTVNAPITIGANYLYFVGSSGAVNGTGGPFIYADVNAIVAHLGVGGEGFKIQNYTGFNMLEVTGGGELTLAGDYLHFGGSGGTVNGTGGPFIYADVNAIVAHLGVGGEGFKIQNYTGFNMLEVTGAGDITASGSGVAYAGISGTHYIGFTWQAVAGSLIVWVDGANQGAMVLAADELRLIGGSETPGTYSFTVGPDTHYVFVRCQGAGGGGAQYGSTYTGGGGGAGGYAEGWYAVTPGQVLIYTVGGVGPGGFPGDGQNGGSSSCGSLCSATGGWGGHSVSDAAGGFSGQGTGGNLNIQGGQGGDGHAIAFGNSGAGDGAGSYFGGGMGGQSTLRTGGSAWGSGGGGSYGAAGAGGFYGQVGLVLIYASS